MSDLRNNVRVAAAILDEELPGWAEKIDLESLHVRDSDCCILGQAHPNGYHAGIDELQRYAVVAEWFKSFSWDEIDPFDSSSEGMWAEEVQQRTQTGGAPSIEIVERMSALV